MTRNQLTYHANKEIERSNRARENETNRHNQVTENETYRSNKAQEWIGWSNAAARNTRAILGGGGLSSYPTRVAPNSQTTVTRTKFLRSDQLPKDYTEVSEVLTNVR